MTELRKAIVILDGSFDIEYKYKREILNKFSTIENLGEFAKASSEYLSSKIENFNEKSYVKEFTDKKYLELCQLYNKKGIIAITEVDDNYPSEYKQISLNPICLYAKGNIKLLNAKNKFSIVGSRKTTPAILKITEDFSKMLADNGVVIVTGVAGGGDLSAVKGAISSGNIICILASGFDNAYREYSREYIKAVEKSGLIISEHRPSVISMPYFYPIRNRLIAGLGKGVLITSGSYKSGTRYTYDFALEYGKDVFAFPYNIGVSSGEICNEIIKNGGYLVTEVEDIITVCNFEAQKKVEINLSDREKVVLQSIKDGNYSVDDLILQTGLKIFELLPVLTTLEIKKLIVKNGSEYSSITN